MAAQSISTFVSAVRPSNRASTPETIVTIPKPHARNVEAPSGASSIARFLETSCNEPSASPFPLGQNDTCLSGFYCESTTPFHGACKKTRMRRLTAPGPNSNATFPPQYCPPSSACQISRLSGSVCDAQGILEPVVCKYGHFCDRKDNGRVQTICPAGHFCPTGSFEPRPCQSPPHTFAPKC